MTTARRYTSVEVCAGAGGQALGLHLAGFTHLAMVENDEAACNTLRRNVALRSWGDCAVLERDLRMFDPSELGLAPGALDLLAGGVPCQPFSAAGLQRGIADERDLFPCFLELVGALRPRAIMIENVRGLLDAKFAGYRALITQRLLEFGYTICEWRVVEARRFGVPQLRPRAILVAMQHEYASCYGGLPDGTEVTMTVFDALKDSMETRASMLRHAHRADPVALARISEAHATWVETASMAGGVAPTLVGGSKKHGGADLGPTRAKKQWAGLGVNGWSLAGSDPSDLRELEDFAGDRGIKLTVDQTKIIQGFPQDWEIVGRKTATYRQVGNAFPPPVARAVGETIIEALRMADSGNRGFTASPTAALRFPLQTSSRPAQPALPGF